LGLKGFVVVVVAAAAANNDCANPNGKALKKNLDSTP